METLTATSNQKTTNEILLRRKNKLVVVADNHSNSTQAKALAINVAGLGYVFSPELMKVLETLSTEKLTELNSSLKTQLSKMVGAHVKHTPLFRDFPNDIPEFIDYDKVVEHLNDTINFDRNFKFLTCGHLIYTDQADLTNLTACPVCDEPMEEFELFSSKKRDNLKENVEFKTINLGHKEEVFSLFTNLLSSKTSISQQDKEDIELVFTSNKNVIKDYFPEQISHKEVLSFVSALVLEHLDSFEFLQGKIKTSTDVLRIAVAMSNGDVSLAKSTKFKKFSKKERRFLLTLLEGCKNKTEDMVRYKNVWIRLGEILHPGDYAKRFPTALGAFNTMRSGQKVETFNSKIEQFMSNKDISSLCLHLTSRPSEFARRLDYMISVSSTNKDIVDLNFVLNGFEKIVDKIPTPTLLQVLSNFYIRTQEDKSIRIIMPKGNLAKVKLLEETREVITNQIGFNIVTIIESCLKERFSKMPALGKVFLDKTLLNYLIPSSQRSASKALKTITRGSQVDLTKDNIVRMFLYWKEPTGNRTDVDLSAVLYDENWLQKSHVSFTQLNSFGCNHSGDIQTAPNGASEFIDIDKKEVTKLGVRYVAMNIYSYTHQPFVELPECFAGTMGRNNPKSGEVFEAKTVKHKFDVAADSFIAIPLILDLQTNKMVWADISLKGNLSFGNSTESNSESVKNMCKAMVQMINFKTNIHDLLNLHAKSRGQLVETKEEADIVFDDETILFDTERIMSEFLA